MNCIDMTDQDAAAIGRAFMKKIPDDYQWGFCPTEYVTDLQNELSDLKDE